MWSSVEGAGICLPLPLSFTVQSLTVMMKHEYISKTENVAASRQAQPKVQCIILPLLITYLE